MTFWVRPHNPVQRQESAAHEPGGGTAGPPRAVQARAQPLVPLLPGSVPAYTIGPTGSNPLAALQWTASMEELQRQAEEDGDFNHVLYNYAFMLTIDRERAITVFHKRMQDTVAGGQVRPTPPTVAKCTRAAPQRE